MLTTGRVLQDFGLLEPMLLIPEGEKHVKITAALPGEHAVFYARFDYEEIINERELVHEGTVLCLGCAGESCYRLAATPICTTVPA